MPELPDVTVYIERLEAYVLHKRLEQVRLHSPFLLRSVDPPLTETHGREVLSLRRLGKRIVIGLEEEIFLVLHLMIAGRLRWRRKGSRIHGRLGLAAFDFDSGTLMLTEASKQKRASLHVVRGEQGLAKHDPGGAEVCDLDAEGFAELLTRRNHTLKHALTDPTLLSGIGNAYSDEILHAAKLSPVQLTQNLDEEELQRLFKTTRETLEAWTARLREEVGDGFPEKVTAFREGMAVHGRYRQPCPRCGSPVQRIVYASNETNYCPTCQTGGRLLADRALSRLLKKDWPRTLEELERRRTS
jgi:formamidopyrimidine-DNA glycosylase